MSRKNDRGREQYLSYRDAARRLYEAQFKGRHDDLMGLFNFEPIKRPIPRVVFTERDFFADPDYGPCQDNREWTCEQGGNTEVDPNF